MGVREELGLVSEGFHHSVDTRKGFLLREVCSILDGETREVKNGITVVAQVV